MFQAQSGLHETDVSMLKENQNFGRNKKLENALLDEYLSFSYFTFKVKKVTLYLCYLLVSPTTGKVIIV